MYLQQGISKKIWEINFFGILKATVSDYYFLNYDKRSLPPSPPPPPSILLFSRVRTELDEADRDLADLAQQLSEQARGPAPQDFRHATDSRVFSPVEGSVADPHH